MNPLVHAVRSRATTLPAAVLALLLLVLAGCGDPPTTEADGGGERPEECGEPSTLDLSFGGVPLDFEPTQSVARRVDEATWLVGIGDAEVDLGSASNLGELPAPPAEGTRVVLLLQSPDGPLRSGQTLTAADLGIGLTVATDGTETPVTALSAQATVVYVDDTTICGRVSVTDETMVSGSFVASTR